MLTYATLGVESLQQESSNHLLQHIQLAVASVYRCVLDKRAGGPKKEEQMPSFANDPIIVRTNTPSGPEHYNGGIYGESTLFNGVRGVSYAPGHGAVVGVSENHTNQAGPGVFGQSDGTGVWGQSKTWMGVYGNSSSTTGGAGVMGEAAGAGVIGKSQTWHGVYGETPSTTGGAGVWGEHKGSGAGVVGKSVSGVGVWATSGTGEAVHAETQSPGVAAIAAYNLNAAGTGAAVFAKKAGNVGHAGFFDGDVHVTGTLSADRDIVLTNADCAEEFTIAESDQVEPGTVMVLGESDVLLSCQTAYDKRVAGVVSGAGNYKPAIVLDKQPAQSNRRPLALMGKVYCKVDAGYGSVAVGDLLTTSPTPGHAMKADDPLKSFGSVIGKALRPLQAGQGLIPILIALQ